MVKIKRGISEQDCKIVDLHFVKSEESSLNRKTHRIASVFSA